MNQACLLHSKEKLSPPKTKNTSYCGVLTPCTPVDNSMEQRQFQRFPLRCRLKVQGKNQSGHPFVETTELINISGGGALFSTRMTDHYVQGQTIKANILLPGTPDIQGSMTTSAKVISVNNRIDSPDDKPNGCIQVAVHFLEPFRLLRRNEPATVNRKKQAASR